MTTPKPQYSFRRAAHTHDNPIERPIGFIHFKKFIRKHIQRELPGKILCQFTLSVERASLLMQKVGSSQDGRLWTSCRLHFHARRAASTPDDSQAMLLGDHCRFSQTRARANFTCNRSLRRRTSTPRILARAKIRTSLGIRDLQPAPWQ